MENLTIHDGSLQPPPPVAGNAQTPQGGPMIAHPSPGRPPPPQPQQLPPQMFTTAAQLLDLTDKKLMICLRDGRKLTGILRSWDQFANLVLQSTIERLYVQIPSTDETEAESSKAPKGYYADQPHGVFIVRGENVLLLGEIDLDKDDEPPPGYEKSDWVTVEKLAKEQKANEKRRDKNKLKKLATIGFEGENLGDTLP